MEPALWQQAAPVVARGAALVAAGLIGEWLLRSFARGAFNVPGNGRKSSKSKELSPVRHQEPRQETIAISETVIMTRRVIVRR
jgi:hypothetical protein